MKDKTFRDRKISERSFHNDRFAAERDPRTPLDRWYTAARAGADLQLALARQYAYGSVVLEYGCADGTFSIINSDLARIAAVYHGIDISDVAVKKASETGKYVKTASFSVMDAEQLARPADYFDIIYGRGILHHLDIERALLEIYRVLRPNGRAIFFEPLGHNFLINLYRRITPSLRTENEHPLLLKDLITAQAVFEKADFRFFGFCSLGTIPLARTRIGSSLLQLAERVDAYLLHAPRLRHLAWHVLLVLQKSMPPAQY